MQKQENYTDARYSIGTYIRLHTDDLWNGMFGIIDDLVGDTIVVHCTRMPLHRYYVNVYDAGSILELV